MAPPLVVVRRRYFVAASPQSGSSRRPNTLSPFSAENMDFAAGHRAHTESGEYTVESNLRATS